MHLCNIRVVEDEQKLARVLESALKAEHYEVAVAPSGDALCRIPR